MSLITLNVVMLLPLLLPAVNQSAGDVRPHAAALRPWPENPWYWEFNGEPILLLGGSDDDNLFQWPEAELIPQLDRLAAAGGNVIRNTMSDRKDKGFEEYPFRQLDSGKYDLEQWNETYWSRFERLLRETARRNIIVQIEVWDRFDYVDNGGNERWQIHPYNPANNVNYTYEDSGFAKRYPDHPGANKQPFFFTTPSQRNNRVVLKYQQAFVHKLLDHSLKYDHVLYCMDNETKAEPAWGSYWARLIRERAAAEGSQVMTTEMWDAWNLRSDEHRQTFDHPELYDFVDVSQNNHNKGDQHWNNFLFVRSYLSGQPRPMNTTKTYGADGNKFGHTDQDAVERFWRHLLAGAASIRFHRPDSGLGLNDRAVNCIRAARKLEQMVPLWSVEPANDLLSDRDENEAFLAADPGRGYLIYFPAGGEVTVNFGEITGAFRMHWVNIESGEWAQTTELSAGRKSVVTAPGEGNIAAAIVPVR
jgi:hypothetical protein